MDAGTVYTDRKTQKVEKQITKVYEEARKDIREKIETFNKSYEKKYAIHMQELKDGKPFHAVGQLDAHPLRFRRAGDQADPVSVPAFRFA